MKRQERKRKMSCQNTETETPFPLQRPDITIVPSEDPPFEVDFKEFACWFAVPEVGDHTLWAIYDPPDWRLTSYCDMKAICAASVHGIDGVEIIAMDHELDERHTLHPWTFFARITDERVEVLATISLEQGKRVVYTMLDELFAENWGDKQRRVRHTARFEEQADGSYIQRAERLCPGETLEAMGTYRVTVGARSFTCLRVLDVKHEITEEDVLIEAYLTPEGRTVLDRRYNGRMWRRTKGGDKPPWDEEFPEHNRIVIDGVTFVHWYDCLSDRACGISADSCESSCLPVS
jgi:hypothetical protein